ncbi:MAG: xanthine dehydrogenase family protein subunit M [Proteobacteria bacterium]|nr:xanthine dehydrogenase family protein subunit M [Pseudomonadota bacterium]
MKAFNYHAPKSTSQALELLRTCGSNTKILAGGTDLLVQMKQRVLTPTDVVDLKRIPDLRGMEVDSEGEVEIGSLTTVADLAASPMISKKFSVLSQAAATIGSLQTRNKATVGGNISRAAPSADLVPALLVLEARAILLGPGGQREVPLSEFFLGPGLTVMGPQEILTRIMVPPAPVASSSLYLKQGRRKSVDLAIVGVAVLVAWAEEHNLCREARIALASVAPQPMRAHQAESWLAGQMMSPELINQCADAAAAEARPISDSYGDEWYKRHLVRALVTRCLRRLSDQEE